MSQVSPFFVTVNLFRNRESYLQLLLHFIHISHHCQPLLPCLKVVRNLASLVVCQMGVFDVKKNRPAAYYSQQIWGAFVIQLIAATRPSGCKISSWIGSWQSHSEIKRVGIGRVFVMSLYGPFTEMVAASNSIGHSFSTKEWSNSIYRVPW